MSKLKDRLADAMAFANMNATELAYKTKIPKASISQYLSGYASPKADRIYLRANALNVSEAWLMGYDVAIETKDQVDIPLYAEVSCGTGMFVDDYIEDYISIPNRYVNHNKEYFAMTAKGDSMIGKGILEGDVLVFEKCQTLENGQVGCFCIDDNYAVCKIYRNVNGMVFLESANDKYDPIIIDVLSECFKIIGKYVCRFTI